jgi:hypothetical protein
VTARAPVGASGADFGPPMPSAEPEFSRKPASTSSPAHGSRLFLIVAAVLAAAWLAVLTLLAIFTANPVMLNVEQVEASPYVVTGTVTGDPAKGQVAVEREWKKHALSGTITVENLPEAGARAGTAYIIPLSRPYDAFRVTESPYSGTGPLIYPASPEAIKQLETILKASSNQAAPK